MSEDTSPENLRKFLESDDPALVQMGLSMAKGAGVPEDLYETIIKLSILAPEEEIQKAAQSLVNLDDSDMQEFESYRKAIHDYTNYKTLQ